MSEHANGESDNDRPTSADPGGLFDSDRPEPGPWNARQERVAVLLASGATAKDASAETGAGVRTIHTWMDQPAFRSFVGSLRDRILDTSIGRLTAVSYRAVEVLEALLGAESESVRLRAATAVIDSMIRTREMAELATRVAELEAAHATNGGPTGWG